MAPHIAAGYFTYLHVIKAAVGLSV